MTEKQFTLECESEEICQVAYNGDYMGTDEVVDLLNELATKCSQLKKENEQLKQVINENEKLIQSTYDELRKLRCIKKNLRRIKTQWDWIMEAIQYD